MARKLLRGGSVAVRLIAAAVVIGAFVLSPLAPVSARGGGPANIINSEGYQRALREERKLYQQAQPQAAAPMTAALHRHHRRH